AEPIPLDQASYFDLTPSDEASELRKQTILALENMGIPVQYSHHEIAPSQQEIDLRYTDALTMADNVMAFRMVVKEVAQSRGEYRAPDPACNPYLAFALLLAAGLRGIEKGYELAPEATNNIFEMTPEERMAEGIDSLPNSLFEALEVMEHSDLVAEVLGEHVFDYFIRNKRLEWADYKSYVTPFEINRYLPVL